MLISLVFITSSKVFIGVKISAVNRPVSQSRVLPLSLIHAWSR